MACSDIRVEAIYFDMDGVLADFARGIREILGTEPPVQGADKAADAELFGAIREIPNFYRRLRPIQPALELFFDLRREYGDRVEVLTGVPNPEFGVVTASDDKMDWAREFLGPEVVVHTVLRREKAQFAKGPGSVLIDDYPRNIAEWRAAGGTGVLFTDADSVRSELESLGIGS
jgi:hypothetical protein